MIELHLLKLRARDDIGAEEEAAIRGAVSDIVEFPADRTAIEADRDLNHSTLLLEGLMGRYKDMRDGHRQITALHIPGDFLDLHSFTLKRLDQPVLAFTPCRAALVPHARLKEITHAFPHLTRVLWFSTNLDACIHREWSVSLGRRTAIARTAHLLCEMEVRMNIVGLTDGGSYALPLTQIELAECLGLTSVHVNRVLKELRERGMAEFRNSKVTVLDWNALTRLADFDPGYLYLERNAR